MYALNIEKTSALMVRSVPVFPRFYRRFVRFIFQFVLVGRYVPRHFGSFSVLFFFFLSVVYGVSFSGRMNDIVKAVTSNVGFVVTDVDISGNKRVAEQEVLRILGLDAQQSILSFDVDKARSILEQQAWVQSAIVQKVYPNRVRISMIEREPYAVWRHDGEVDIIDSTGYVIVPFQADLVQKLPLVVGQGAQTEAKLFIESLSLYPQLYDHVRAYVRVGGRRWDILLDNGMRIMLPEKGAIERLAVLIKEGTVNDLFLRDILSVDLRLSDRITVALSDEALALHRAVVLEEERMLKELKVGSL
ncbi:cell division protein FtsQ/DivIB [Bartonella sp. A05]|uniref:cell division protein FtsQ/DivIB n=1 Tax=Bartonella sp. A05 TaxID=2967261 RepID=UPI0022A990D8|nr:cell division protein FtsQ/DivIB [Bartonella sp. A05]MCZ2204057.1 FtsQ-type POTRA domain-containing protein [Bartonella sp. A05]